MCFIKNFNFYLPKLNTTITIKALNESNAVWKLCNMFKLREEDLEDFKMFYYKKK